MEKTKIEKINGKTIIVCEYGDPSKDGHNQFNTFYILMNGSYDDFLFAKEQIKNKIGFDIDNCCLEEKTLTEKEYYILDNIGFIDEIIENKDELWYDFDDDDEESKRYINPEIYEMLIVKLLNEINPEFEAEIIEFEHKYSTHGGYEFFTY